MEFRLKQKLPQEAKINYFEQKNGEYIFRKYRDDTIFKITRDYSKKDVEKALKKLNIDFYKPIIDIAPSVNPIELENRKKEIDLDKIDFDNLSELELYIISKII